MKSTKSLIVFIRLGLGLVRIKEHKVKKQHQHRKVAPGFPKPCTLRSRVKPVLEMIAQADAVPNVPADIASRDPRTVASYKVVLPELRQAVEGLQRIVDSISFTEDIPDKHKSSLSRKGVE